MTNFNALLNEAYKTSNILPIVFDCTLVTDKEAIAEYMISETELALFLDIDDYSIDSSGGENNIYHDIFSSSNNVIDLSTKRPVIQMIFRQSDYNIYLALEEIILKSFEEQKLIEVKDYHFLKTRSLLIKNLKVNGGINRVLNLTDTPNSYNELRYMPNGFTLTAMENIFTII